MVCYQLRCRLSMSSLVIGWWLMVFGSYRSKVLLVRCLPQFEANKMSLGTRDIFPHDHVKLINGAGAPHAWSITSFDVLYQWVRLSGIFHWISALSNYSNSLCYEVQVQCTGCYLVYRNCSNILFCFFICYLITRQVLIDFSKILEIIYIHIWILKSHHCMKYDHNSYCDTKEDYLPAKE